MSKNNFNDMEYIYNFFDIYNYIYVDILIVEMDMRYLKNPSLQHCLNWTDNLSSFLYTRENNRFYC